MAPLLRVPEVAAGRDRGGPVRVAGRRERGVRPPATPIAVVETEKAVVEVEADSRRRRAAAPGRTDGTTGRGRRADGARSATEAEPARDLDALLGRPRRRAPRTARPRTAAPDAAAGERRGAPSAAGRAAPSERWTRRRHRHGARSPTDSSDRAGNGSGTGRTGVRQPAGPAAAREAGLDSTDRHRHRVRAAGSSAQDVERRRRRRRDTGAVRAGERPRRRPRAARPRAARRDAAGRVRGGAAHADAAGRSPRRAARPSKQAIPHFYVRGPARVDALLRCCASSSTSSRRPADLGQRPGRPGRGRGAHRRCPRRTSSGPTTRVRRFDVGRRRGGHRLRPGLVTPVLRDVERATSRRDRPPRSRTSSARGHERQAAAARPRGRHASA